jgi:hypothetical protein
MVARGVMADAAGRRGVLRITNEGWPKVEEGMDGTGEKVSVAVRMKKRIWFERKRIGSEGRGPGERTYTLASRVSCRALRLRGAHVALPSGKARIVTSQL